MTNKTTAPQAAPKKDIRMPLLAIACAVLLLALIVVSAFAYQWHDENTLLSQQNSTLRAINDASTLDSLNNDLTETTLELNALRNENEEYERIIKQYEEILTENDLMPED